jgi:hypothetical protein
MEYFVAAASSGPDLIHVVNLMLKNGWKPQGGVTVAKDQGGSVYAQAMIKESK